MPKVRQANKRSARKQQKSPNKASPSGISSTGSPNRRRILPLAAGRSHKCLEVAPGPLSGSKARIANVLLKSKTKKTTPRTSPGPSLLIPHPSSNPNQPLHRTLPLPMSAKKTKKSNLTPFQSILKATSKSVVDPYNAKARKSVSSLTSSSAKKPPPPVRKPHAKSPQVTKSTMSSKTTKSSEHIQHATSPQETSPQETSPQKKQKVAENGTASNPVDIEDSPLFDDDDEIEIIDASEAAVNMVQAVQNNSSSQNQSNATGDDDDDDEVRVVGHVNHVELPHLRQHCTAFPFDDTPSVYDVYVQSVVTVNAHSCPLCYCFVCDCPAKDCSKWHSGESGKFAFNHCCATEKLDLWVRRRKQNHKTADAATAAANNKKRKSPCRLPEPDDIITIDDSDPEDLVTS